MTIREQILENIKSTLETIRVTNGYVNDIASVQRWLQKGNTFRLIPCIIINAGPEEIEQTPNPLVTCKFNRDLNRTFLKFVLDEATARTPC